MFVYCTKNRLTCVCSLYKKCEIPKNVVKISLLRRVYYTVRFATNNPFTVAKVLHKGRHGNVINTRIMTVRHAAAKLFRKFACKFFDL